ncbi:MAG: hypothetical protein V1734_03545 [Nanoarchaeota archaeon]
MIVLQLPKRATQGRELGDITKMAGEYKSLARYVLVDPSAGEGKDFDVVQCSELMNGLHSAMPNTRIGIAGGFDGINVIKKVSGISEIYHDDFCIDAQAKLRTKDNKYIDVGKAGKYIKNAARVLL